MYRLTVAYNLFVHDISII